MLQETQVFTGQVLEEGRLKSIKVVLNRLRAAAQSSLYSMFVVMHEQMRKFIDHSEASQLTNRTSSVRLSSYFC